MNPGNHDRLLHIRDAAQAAISFLDGKSPDDLAANIMLRFALVRAVEIIGEASTKLTPEFKEAHPSIPWKTIVGMRNRLVHG